METAEERGTDSLGNLEERITRAVQLITELRAQNTSLSKRVATLEEEVRSAQAATQQREQELGEMRGERKEVRSRIEKLLNQLDLLSAS